MGSIDRYGNMGIEFNWVREYFKSKDDFWTSPHSLGTNMVKNLKSFLNDSEVTTKNKFTKFGELIESLDIESTTAWALMLCNLSYTSEFNWWIKNTLFSYSYTPEAIFAMLDDSMSKNSRDHIVAAYRNIFISITPLGNEIGTGVCDYEIKGGKRKLNSIVRYPWSNPDPLVILYSLYKFSEALNMQFINGSNTIYSSFTNSTNSGLNPFLNLYTPYCGSFSFLKPETPLKS